MVKKARFYIFTAVPIKIAVCKGSGASSPVEHLLTFLRKVHLYYSAQFRWSCKQYVPPRRRNISTGLNCDASQSMVICGKRCVFCTLLTYLLTPWSKVLLEKLTGSAGSQEIPRIFGTRRLLTVLTSARHLSLSWANSIQSPQPPPTSWRSILILSSHLRLVFCALELNYLTLIRRISWFILPEYRTCDCYLP